MEYEIECPNCGAVATVSSDGETATISVDIVTLTPLCIELATGTGLQRTPFCPTLERRFHDSIRR